MYQEWSIICKCNVIKKFLELASGVGIVHNNGIHIVV